MENVFEKYPKQIRKSFQSDSLSYYLNIQYFALKGDCPKNLKNKLVYSVEGVHVIKADPRGFSYLAILPTYRLEDNPLPYVPTGKIFIRFSPEIQAKDKVSGLQTLGYCIDELSEYAIHTAWIKDCNDDVGEALSKLNSLRALEHLENAEPQMLIPVREY